MMDPRGASGNTVLDVSSRMKCVLFVTVLASGYYTVILWYKKVNVYYVGMYTGCWTLIEHPIGNKSTPSQLLACSLACGIMILPPAS